MTPVFSARRRAEEFNSLTEHSAGNDLTDARYAEFLEIVSVLRATPPVEARPAFVTSLRGRLMVAARTDLVPSQASLRALPARRPRDRRIAAAVGGFAIVGATTSMAMAAQTALPGDALYPLKRAIENVETGISVNEGQKGATMLANASGRLDEITVLSREGSHEDTTAIAETLDTFAEQATVASDLLLADYASTGDESSISELLDFTSLSMETLATLEDLIPTDARDELLHAARVLTRIDAQAEQACPDCGGAGIDEIPKILAGTSTFAGVGTTVEPAGQATQTGAGAKGRGTKLDPTHDGSTDQEGALSPGAALDPGDTDPETSGGDAPADQPADDPVEELTEGLVETQPTSNPSGLSVLPGVDGTADGLEDATAGLTPP